MSLIVGLTFIFSSIGHAELVEPQQDPKAFEQLNDLPWVQQSTTFVQSKNFEGSSFANSTPYIVSRSLDISDEWDKNQFVRQNEIFMFLSNDHRWLCEFRLNVIWKLGEPVDLVEDSFESDTEAYCYPRI